MKDYILILIACLAIVVCIAGAILQPYLEASSYRRLTGKQVGYWDAVFLDLRIQEQVK